MTVDPGMDERNAAWDRWMDGWPSVRNDRYMLRRTWDAAWEAAYQVGKRAGWGECQFLLGDDEHMPEDDDGDG